MPSRTGRRIFAGSLTGEIASRSTPPTSLRETLDKDLTDYGDREIPDELRQRIARADQAFRELTYESNDCVWGDARKYDPTLYWYYYRWQSK